MTIKRELIYEGVCPYCDEAHAGVGKLAGQWVLGCPEKPKDALFMPLGKPFLVVGLKEGKR